MENSLSCIPILYQNIIEKHPEIGKSVDSLCRVLCRRYAYSMEYAQPRLFWQKYIKKKTNKTNKKRNRSSLQTTEEEQQSSTSEKYSSDESDNESLLNSKRRRTETVETEVPAKNCDEISMKYIFNINNCN